MDKRGRNISKLRMAVIVALLVIATALSLPAFVRNTLNKNKATSSGDDQVAHTDVAATQATAQIVSAQAQAKVPGPLSPPEQPDSAANTQDPETIKPVPDNCHDNPFLEAFAKHEALNATSRQKYASNAASALGVGSDLNIISAGDDSQYLLFVGSSGSESDLTQLAILISHDDNMKAGICEQGFAGVQFIIRDENFHQALISKFPTSAKEEIHYTLQHTGAHPM